MSERNNKGGLRRGRAFSQFLDLVLPRFFLSLALFSLFPTTEGLEQANLKFEHEIVYGYDFSVLLAGFIITTHTHLIP